MFRQFLYLYLSFALVVQMSCFFGRRRKDGDSRTKTHKDITFEGTYNAINRYIVQNKGSSSINDFFKNAHSFVKTCKTRLNRWKDRPNKLLRKIGMCLYTVQSFYSNTNWIEMYGEVVYENFGIGSIMDVATADDDPCLDMGDPLVGCEDNIRTSKLTSGYHSRWGNTKPTRPLNSTHGPCSHGGPEDSSRNVIAKCGINKDSVTESWSPHFHLHDAAYRTTVNATEEFLVRTDTGILSTLGQSLFDQLFHLKVREDISLAFAVDFSGSMSNDIAAVKEYIINLVYSTTGSANEPADYVLSLFNDPESLHKDFVYTSGMDMIDTVGSIAATGGGDCPEYAASGILKAIELARPSSTVYVFTDASAKDEDRALEVISSANKKNIILTTLLTGTCSFYIRRKRDVFGRRKRDADSFYEEIADATGGTVYFTSKSELGSILSLALDTVFPSSEIIIDSFSWPSSSSTEQEISVDDLITVVTITIIGSTAAANADIRYENGTTETYTSSTANRIYTDAGEIIISLQNPPPSTLRLIKNVDSVWNVNITAQSSLKADVDILQYEADGDLISFHGMPVTGHNYSVSWTVYNLGSNGTCDNISIVATDGTHISSYSASKSDSDFSHTCSSDVDIPKQHFKLKLMGIDNSGYAFSRKISTTFIPSLVEIIIADSEEEAVVGHETVIDFDITNFAGYSNTYRVSISDYYGYVVSPVNIDYILDAGSSDNGTFILKPTTASTIMTYSVTVTETATNNLQQNITLELLVVDVVRPECSVVNSKGTCESSSLEAGNCSSLKWTASTEVTFSGTTLNAVSTTAGSYVVLTHDNINYLLPSPFAINITGDCCYSTVRVDVTDIDGYTAQCDIAISTDEQSSDDTSFPAVPIIIGIVAAIMVTTVATIATGYFCYHKGKATKIIDSSPDIQKPVSPTKDNWIDGLFTTDKPDNIQKPVFKSSPIQW